MNESGYAEALRMVFQGTGRGGLDRVLAAACAPLPAWDPVVYLADFSRQVMLPLTASVPAEDVAGTLAGRAFTTGEPVTSDRDDCVRVWVPVVEQWDLLPPWSACFPGALIAGMLEPAYDVAGDAFDYAASGGLLHFAIMDGMGHGIGSTMLAGLAVGAYRHARRRGAPIPEIYEAVDQALAGYYGDDSFATGVIGTLALGTGRLEWSCAGHPPPLLLRGRKVVAELECTANLPFGLGGGRPAVESRDLEPGDAVLLYTDGVTESRTPDGELFGLERLADLLEREAASGRSPGELLRRLVRTVLDYQADGLRDDATLLLLQWTGT